MRRNSRFKNNSQKILNDKIIMYAGIGVTILAFIVVALLMYSKKISDEVKEGTMSLEQIANLNSDNTSNENTESASTEIGKTKEESENELERNSTNTINMINNNTNSTSNLQIENTNKPIQKKETTNTEHNKTVQTNVEEKKELSFEKPVDGEITKEFAKDNLLYSNTLKEWTTHMGIDIKAEKTTVVKAAEKGVIKSIKNDPRYGLTIVIDHGDNMQTIYSNLLTSEFVVEGENVEKGQSIGTVGNTAVFEIADEPHLHFEILKDSIQIDPNIYLK